MSHTSWSLLILAMTILFLMGLAVALVRFLQRMMETSSRSLVDSQASQITSISDLTSRMHSILVNSTATLSERHQEQFLQILIPVLNQQELLVNRLLGKDAIAVTQLDQKLIVSQTSEPSDTGYYGGSDYDEMQAAGLDPTGVQEQGDSGLFGVHPGDV